MFFFFCLILINYAMQDDSTYDVVFSQSIFFLFFEYYNYRPVKNNYCIYQSYMKISVKKHTVYIHLYSLQEIYSPSRGGA